MSEVLVRYVARIFGSDGSQYSPQACGGIANDGLWEGWIEFVSDAGTVRTGRETEQPNRDALLYWAEGLTVAYLEGALVRATSPRMVVQIDAVTSPHFDRPARRPGHRAPRPGHAILDPFATYSQGEDLLRSQLNALSHDNLVAIIEDYELPIYGTADRPGNVLVDAIVAAVRADGGADQSRPPRPSEAQPEKRP